MRSRTHRVIAGARQQWMGALALFLVLTGGVAYAADTIGSADVINESLLSEDIKNNEVKQSDLAGNAVQTGKIANNQVFSEDVRDDTLAGGGLTAGDLADDAVSASELKGATIFDARDAVINDAVGGGASESVLLTPAGYEVIGRCLRNPADTVQASIFVRSVNAPARTTAVDSNAPNGVNNVTNLAHVAAATLVSVGPTTFTTWHTGQYAVTTFETNPAGSRPGFNGNVAAATKFGPHDCRFQATALGGGFTPE